MKQIRRFGVVAAALIGLAAWAALAAGEAVWVTKDGDEQTIEAHAVFLGEGGTEFDVATLADGESRVIGEGAKQVRATRNGDEVTIERAASGEERELRVTCHLPQDTCKVITFADDPQKLMLMVRKERVCVHGEGDCEIDAELLPDGATGERIIVHKIATDESGTCPHAAAGGDVEVKVIRGDGPEKVIVVEGAHGVVLRCPQGDTTMRLEDKEAEGVYLCPKHAVPLEKVDLGTMHKKIRVVAEPKAH